MYNNFFYGSINGNIIEQIDQTNNSHIPIGHTNAEFDQLLEVAEKYKARLEEAGLIKKQLTQEEMQAKQNELLESLVDKFEKIESRIAKIEGGSNDKHTTSAKSSK